MTTMMKTTPVMALLFVLAALPSARAQDDTKGDAPTKGAATVAKGDDKPAPEEKKEEKADVDEGRSTALVANMILKVVNPREARVELEKLAEELGGHPILVTDAGISIKLPPKKLSQFIETASTHGLVVEKTMERADLTQEIAQLEGQLKSKQKVLARLRGFFDDSNVAATLRIEQNMTSLVSEIEYVKGRLRVLRDRSKWAVVEISFRFRERDKIIYVHSPFEWLNTVNLDEFIGEF